MTGEETISLLEELDEMTKPFIDAFVALTGAFSLLYTIKQQTLFNGGEIRSPIPSINYE